MAERREGQNPVIEFTKDLLSAPLSYARELRNRPINLVDKILVGEIAAVETFSFLLSLEKQGFNPAAFLLINACFYGMIGCGVLMGRYTEEKRELEKQAIEKQERRQFYIDSMNA